MGMHARILFLHYVQGVWRFGPRSEIHFRGALSVAQYACLVVSSRDTQIFFSSFLCALLHFLRVRLHLNLHSQTVFRIHSLRTSSLHHFSPNLFFRLCVRTGVSSWCDAAGIYSKCHNGAASALWSEVIYLRPRMSLHLPNTHNPVVVCRTQDRGSDCVGAFSHPAYSTTMLLDGCPSRHTPQHVECAAAGPQPWSTGGRHCRDLS